MGFVFAWALGALFEAAERTESVGGFIVKTDVGTTPAMLSAGSLMSWGPAFLSACVYRYLDYCSVSPESRAVRMGAAFFGLQKWGRVGVGNHSLTPSVRSNKAFK